MRRLHPTRPKPTVRVEPHPSRLDPADDHWAEVVEAHRRALRRGESLYVDPITGHSVMSAAYLAARGTCCETGCRHCPYVWDRAGPPPPAPRRDRRGN